MVDLVDSVLARCGLGPEPQQRAPDGPFNAVAEHRRQALISKLESAKASIDILIALVTNHGDDDEAFVTQARQLGTLLDDAGGDAMRFHFARECRGLC